MKLLYCFAVFELHFICLGITPNSLVLGRSGSRVLVSADWFDCSDLILTWTASDSVGAMAFINHSCP